MILAHYVRRNLGVGETMTHGINVMASDNVLSICCNVKQRRWNHR